MGWLLSLSSCSLSGDDEKAMKEEDAVGFKQLKEDERAVEFKFHRREAAAAEEGRPEVMAINAPPEKLLRHERGGDELEAEVIGREEENQI